MTIETKDILFSENCYHHTDWAFPEIDTEYPPIYNPLIDAFFGHFWFDPKIRKENKRKRSQELNRSFHEIAHSSRFQTSTIGLLQVCGALIYELIARIPPKSLGGSPLKVPAPSNWPTLDNLARILNILHRGAQDVEEIFNLAFEISNFEEIHKEGSELFPFNDSPKENTPKKIEKNYLKKYKKKFGEDFEWYYRKWKIMFRLLPGRQVRTIQLYVMNVDWWEEELDFFTKEGSQEIITTNPDIVMPQLGPINLPSNNELEKNIHKLRRILPPVVSPPLKHTYAPIDNLDYAISLFEKHIKNRRGMIQCLRNIAKENELREKSSRGFDKLSLDIFDGPFNERLKELRGFNLWVENSFRLGVNANRSFIIGVLRDLMEIKYRVRNYLTYLDNPDHYSQSINGPSINEIENILYYLMEFPSFAISPKGQIKQNLALNHWGAHRSFKYLVFFESMRQQIFQGKGLVCPGEKAGPYFIPPCSYIEGHFFELSECWFRPFLKSIWENTEPDSEAIEWTKPACL